MKKLQFKHVMKTAKILKAANINDVLAELTNKVTSSSKKVDVEKVGTEAVIAIFSACADDVVEQRLYELLDDVFETNVAELSLEETVEKFKQLAKENNLSSFFKSAGQLSQ